MVLRAIFRILARLHLWPQAALAGSYAGRISEWGGPERDRLAYAFLMARRDATVRTSLARILRRERDSSAETNLWLARAAWQIGARGLSELLNRRTGRIFTDCPGARIAARQADFARKIRSNALAGSLAQSIDNLSLAPGETVVVVPASARYDPLFRVWRSQLLLHARGRLVVLAMDSAMAAACGNDPEAMTVDLSAYFSFDHDGRIDGYSKQNLWVLRVLALRELAARGHTVISLDLDAILLRPIEELLASLPAADIVAQRDYSIPVDVARKLGFVVCCGFMAIFPTRASKAFLDLYVDQCAIELDDQLALNHLLASHSIQNRSETPTALSFDSCGARWVCPAAALVSRDLDQGTFIRHFNRRGESIEELRRRLGIG